MALNKRKVLENARKFAQKGAKAKALKEYNVLLKVDPRDAKLLLEVGDAYRRWGQSEEAIAQYGKVAQQYRQDGFDARAVAVFKQILNLDPKHYAAYVSLSELYQRMGLDSEAISALQTAADGYSREGRKSEALDLLRQTAALDPTNTTSRLKVAELLRTEGMEAEAVSEYRAVAEELESQQDRDQLITVLERVLEIRPDELEALNSLIRNLIAGGDLDRAESYAIRALNVSAEPAQFEMLIDLYSQRGDESKLNDATRGLAQLYRDRGDEEKARELMQRLPVDEAGSSSRLAVDVSEIAEPDLGDEELLDEEPFLTLGNDKEASDSIEGADAARDLDSDELELDLGVNEPSRGKPGDRIQSVVLPEGDPDQLLAEANVYLRYGKRDQAIASLRGVIAQDPNHRAALEKLGEAYADAGQNEEAVEIWQRAAVQIGEAGDSEALAVLKDRVAALDPAAAQQISHVTIVAPAIPEVQFDLDVEVDLDLDSAIDEITSSDTESGLAVEAMDDEFEIEIDDDPFLSGEETEGIGADVEVVSGEPDPAPGIEEAAPQTDSDNAGLELDLSDDLNIQLDLDEEDETDADYSGDAGLSGAEDLTNELNTAGDDVIADDEAVEFDFDVDEMSDSSLSPELDRPTESSGGQSTTAAAKISEELEEAEFYLAQDMYDEAEAILTRILAVVPNHPSALLRMGEIEVGRGNTPDQVVSPMSPSLLGDNTIRDFETTEQIGEEEVGNPNEPEDESEEPFEDLTEESVAQVVAEDHSDEDSDAGNDNFDLREALADVLADDEELPNDDASSGIRSTVEDGFGSIFSDFKKGVSETLEEGDFETRYDLGIAYREMGLYEDAIGEFRICLDSPERRFDSLYLMGLSARDLGRWDDSVNHLEQALALPDIDIGRLAGVYFDLSIAQQGAGDLERARATVQRVLELDPEFPKAAERLAKLESGAATSPQLAIPGEVFESFDELFDDDGDDEGGDAAMAEDLPGVAMESFGDLIEEAEADDGESEEIFAVAEDDDSEVAVDVADDGVIEDAQLIEDELTDTPSGEDTHSGKKPGRKKISFV